MSDKQNVSFSSGDKAYRKIKGHEGKVPYHYSGEVLKDVSSTNT